MRIYEMKSIPGLKIDLEKISCFSVDDISFDIRVDGVTFHSYHVAKNQEVFDADVYFINKFLDSRKCNAF